MCCFVSCDCHLPIIIMDLKEEYFINPMCFAREALQTDGGIAMTDTTFYMIVVR